MAATWAESRDRAWPDRHLVWIAALSALAGFAALQAAAFRIAGVFEYPLDDVYIHLAMAEGIMEGTYGINPGEAGSASSSILFPFLLLPFPGTEFQRLLPLVWNALAVAANGALWGLIVAASVRGGVVALLLAAAGPLALNMPHVAFTGMEHALHATASLAIVYGLWRFLETGRISVLLVAAVVAAPLLRFEGLALSLTACGLLCLSGRWRAGVGLALAAVLPVAGFAGFLVSIGLDPLPGSVAVKLANAGGRARLDVPAMVYNFAMPNGRFLGALVFVALAIAPVIPAFRTPAAFRLLLAVGAAGAAHVVAGRVGWMDRYEHYAVCMLVAGILVSGASVAGRARWYATGIAAAALAVSAALYLPKAVNGYVWNTRAIHGQQAQMARLAQDFLKMPVAANDIGRVAWSNPLPILDVWGLVSAEARAVRLSPDGPQPGWADALVRDKGIQVAMVYEDWLREGIGAGWTPVADLVWTGRQRGLGGLRVTLFATVPGAVPELREALNRFAPTLPEGAVVEFRQAGEGE